MRVGVMGGREHRQPVALAWCAVLFWKAVVFHGLPHSHEQHVLHVLVRIIFLKGKGLACAGELVSLVPANPGVVTDFGTEQLFVIRRPTM